MLFQHPHKAPLKNKYFRVFNCILGQKGKTISCPEEPRLDGKRVLVTGGAAGVGEFISRDLIARGAEVTAMARGRSQGTNTIEGLKTIQADLTNSTSIVTAVNSHINEPFDIVICNAGLVSREAEVTSDGVERTFAANVLGHHILYRLLIDRNLLNTDARIIMTSGDIYIMEDDCNANASFDQMQKVYSRSKLGNLWQSLELTSRYPNLHPISVHPGVVASGFSGAKVGFAAWLRNHLLISEQAGAQSALIAATQTLPRGSYWHNKMGLVNLPKSDPALDQEKSARLWQQLESLAAPYL